MPITYTRSFDIHQGQGRYYFFLNAMIDNIHGREGHHYFINTAAYPVRHRQGVRHERSGDVEKGPYRLGRFS